ncbi:hypothetical protein BKA70DRAFT_1029979, partial [Coprinopsis sp. MPI-PUGE-AT-0042]
YHLKGVVYGDGNHFTSRFIANDGSVWFHDGIETGRDCVLQGKLTEDNCHTLARCGGKRGIAVLYA